MAPEQNFSEQVRLLVSLLPHIAKQECFALKGGTAINLFLRDMPRLSVDIDLTYLPVADRSSSLAAIDTALSKIATDIERVVPGCKVQALSLKGTSNRIKLLAMRGDTAVKVEVTPVLRGCLYPPQKLDVVGRVRDSFGYARVQVLAFEDLYAGKICAALDRQHPRDLFDVQILLAEEGISSALKDAFLVYLLGHNRPMVELIDPVLQNIEAAYRRNSRA
jgi:predicted nucleotidyltransferase component of viral defense system